MDDSEREPQNSAAEASEKKVKTISLMDALADSDDERKKKKKKKKSKKKKKVEEKSEPMEDKEEEPVVYKEAVIVDEAKEAELRLQNLEISKLEEKAKTKKLSNKERRKLKAAKEAIARHEEYKSASKSSKTNFAVSSTKSNIPKEVWENATDIDIPQFSISAYGKTLFQDAHLKISAGRRYGIVGPNGKGKTTLLKQLANGELEIPPKIDCLYVEQEVTADDTLAVDMVMQADTVRTQLLAQEEQILADLEKEELDAESFAKLQTQLETVTNELKLRGNDTAEARALSILYGLGFDSKMQYTKTKHFSGGWRMRVSLARALFVKPTLLLLDEPTNHLDLNAVIWLDTYLSTACKSTLLVVSHDQDFLDSICTDIIHLDQKQLFYYKGNYSVYRTQLEKHKERMMKLYKQQQKQLNQMKKQGTSSKKAKQEITKKQRERGNAKKNKGQMQQTEAASLNTDNLLTRPKDYVVTFDFPTPSDITPPIISVDEVSFRYGGKGTELFSNVSFGIDMESRITIVGKNGVGKSTLLNLITGEIEPTEGEIKRNRHVRVGKYHQHFVDILPMNLTPVEYLQQEFARDKVNYQLCRNKLGKFGLEGSAHELKMINLSGGQKSRVVFTYLSFLEPHILVLDEPTNNLDLESIEALIEAINAYEGGVILVTHDARLITECEMRLWVIENKDIFEVKNFDQYKDDIYEDIRKEEEKNKKLVEEKLLKKKQEREEKMRRLKQRQQKK